MLQGVSSQPHATFGEADARVLSTAQRASAAGPAKPFGQGRGPSANICFPGHPQNSLYQLRGGTPDVLRGAWGETPPTISSWIAQEDAEAHYVWANTQPAAGTPYFLLSIRRHEKDFVFVCDLIPRYDLNCNAWSAERACRSGES